MKQPITAAITDAKTSLRWLSRGEPDVERARKAIARVLTSGTRAADIIDNLAELVSLAARLEPQRHTKKYLSSDTVQAYSLSVLQTPRAW